ncbi:MAG: TonB-dependent receptor [Woeseia sp.]
MPPIASSLLMRTGFFACLATAIVFWCPPAASQANPGEPPAEPLEEIVVVANKQARSIRDVAANVTVFAREDFDANLAVSITDVLRYTPGIDEEWAGTRFGHEGINIRGIGGNRVAVLVDGVPLSDQFDVGSFSNATRDFLNTGLIHRMEILHGPASALYGSAAIGGVIAVQTPDPRTIAQPGAPGGELQTVWRGADDSRHGTALMAADDGRRGIVLGGSWRDGSQSDSAAAAEILDLRHYRRRSGLVKVVVDDSTGGTWRLSALHQEADVSSDLNAMLGSGRFRTTTALEGDDTYQMTMITASREFGSPGEWVDSGVLRAYFQKAEVQQSTLDERALAARPVSIDRYFQFDQDIRGIEVNLHRTFAFKTVEHRLGAGLEYREHRTEEYRDGLERGLVDGVSTNVILGEVFPLRDFPLSTTREWGAFVEDSVALGNWSVIAALRADRYRLEPHNDAMFAEDYPFANPVSLAESDLSPKLALMYRFGEIADLYAQYARGFRAPPYEDANIGLEIPVFNLRAIPNPDLRSETSDGFEIGLRIRADMLRLHASFFHTDYDDFIESRARVGTDPASGRILFQARNIEQAVISGFEAGWEVQGRELLRDFTLSGSLYKARGENRDGGQPLNSVGPAQAVLGLVWQPPDGARAVRLQATSTGSWDDRDESAGPLFKPAGHTVLDVYVTQRLAERVMLRAALRNVTDRIAWDWTAVRGVPPDDPLIPHLARPGRNVSVSLQVQW